MHHHEIEDGELDKDEFPKNKDGIKRVPMSQWQSRPADLYERVDLVGEGTFGKVYKAKYKPSSDKGKEIKSSHVALKRILMDNEKEGFPITAIREIMILKRLNHKNIINLIEIVTSKPSDKNKYRGNVYLVFEYMEHDLSGLTDRKVDFSISQIKCIMNQILLGVSYIHSNNIIHRDIKGANILINNKGDVKIADFGLARVYSDNPNKKYTNRVVTLWYRSPELLLGSTSYGPAIDMWSVGCVFSELLTGFALFRGNKDNEQIEKIFEKCGTPTEETWKGVTSLPNYQSMMPRTKYPNVLKSYYVDNKKVDDLTLDLLSQFLELDPTKRITAEKALKHPFFNSGVCSPEDLPKIEKDTHEYQSRQNRHKMQQAAQQRPNIARNDMMVSKQQYNVKKERKEDISSTSKLNILFEDQFLQKKRPLESNDDSYSKKQKGDFTP